MGVSFIFRFIYNKMGDFMKKKLIALLVVVILIVLLSACNGFNSMMYNHLSNEDNYHAYQIVIADMNRQEDGELVIKAKFDNYRDVRPFLGVNPNRDVPLDKYIFELKVTAENHLILKDNGYFENVSVGDRIEVCTSSWIYMDSNFFYIASLSHNGKEYLGFDDGMQNIKRMMENQRSLF